MDQSNGDVVVRPHSMPFEAHGKLQSFDIILDRHDGPNGVGVYSPGELLSGHVRLELSQRMTVNNIDLLVQGTGNAGWRARGIQGDEVLSDDEVYLNEIAELVGKRSNEMVTLSPGEHIFPFACDLPWELPATFTGSHGNVSYLVKVVVQADRNEPTHREPCIATNIFLVESRLSMEGLSDQLNSYRIDYKHPVKTSALATGSSSVKVSMFLPRRAYDIGDTIVVNMSLTNTSKKAVKNMSLALVLEAVYRVRDRTVTERLLVIDHDDEFVVRHLESRQWRHVGLNVPRCIPPTGLPHSNLISIKYWLVFKAELDRSPDIVMLQTPVLIGMQLPDEMKLDSSVIDGSFAAAAAAETGPATPEDAASGRQPPSSRILYQGRREPQIDYQQASGRQPSTVVSPGLQKPLYVDVKKTEPQQQQQQQRPQPQQQQQLQPPLPQAHYQPLRVQQQQPQASLPRVEADSQVISMRFADELDDHSPYGQPHHYQQQQDQPHQQSKVSRNPIFVPEDDANVGGAGSSGGGGGGGFYNGAHERRLGGSSGGGDDRGLTALDASLRNGTEEVLY